MTGIPDTFDKQENDGMTTTEPNPDCPDCAEQLKYDPADAVFACGNGRCALFGTAKPVWSALEEAGMLLAPVTGLPRPTRQGLPVPWVTPWSAARVWWRAMDVRLLALARPQRVALPGVRSPPARAGVGTGHAFRRGAAGRALHQERRDLARASCPHLSGTSTRSSAHLITRAQLTSDGRPLLQAQPSAVYFLQQWEPARAPSNPSKPVLPATRPRQRPKYLPDGHPPITRRRRTW